MPSNERPHRSRLRRRNTRARSSRESGRRWLVSRCSRCLCSPRRSPCACTCCCPRRGSSSASTLPASTRSSTRSGTMRVRSSAGSSTGWRITAGPIRTRSIVSASSTSARPLLWWRSWCFGRSRWRITSRRDHGSEAAHSPAASARGSAQRREPRDPRRSRHPHEVSAGPRRATGSAPAPGRLLDLPHSLRHLPGGDVASPGAIADRRQLFVGSGSASRGAAPVQNHAPKYALNYALKVQKRIPPRPANPGVLPLSRARLPAPHVG